MGLQLVTPASGTLVTLDEAKLACEVDETVGGAQDAWLTRKITAIEAEIELFLNRSVREQTWLLALDQWSDTIELPEGPVTGVVSVEYDDDDGAAQTLDPDSYTLDLVSSPQWLVRNSDASWPALLDAINVVRITFTAAFAIGPRLELVKDVCLDELARRYEDKNALGLSEGSRVRLFPLRRIMI